MDAACPTQIVVTGDAMNVIVSYMASPAVTLPPGVLMYRFMGFSGESASRKSNWATMDAETVSSTAPFRHMIRSWLLLSAPD